MTSCFLWGSDILLTLSFPRLLIKGSIFYSEVESYNQISRAEQSTLFIKTIILCFLH